MMRQQLKSVDSHPEELAKISGKVIDKFSLKDSAFLIVLFNENVGDAQTHNLIFSTDTPNENLCCSRVGYLELDGKRYSIVKPESSLGNTEPVLSVLTERELQIATLAALGRSNKQIASHLHISSWTVSAHLRRIFIKLNVDSRAAMVYRCASLIERVHQLHPRSY